MTRGRRVDLMLLLIVRRAERESHNSQKCDSVMRPGNADNGVSIAENGQRVPMS